MDLSGLIPEARPIAARAAGVYRQHTAPWFVGLLAHGSAVKGGVIPNCSDLDFQLYLDDEAFAWHGQLPLALGYAVRRDLEGLDLWPFRYLQCYPRRCEAEPGWVGPIPGAYHLLAGRLPVPEATARDLRQAAQRALAGLDPAPDYLIGKLLGPGSERFSRALRLLCTQVWPVLYQVLTLQSEDPIALWNLPKQAAITRLSPGDPLGQSIRRFHASVTAYYPAEEGLEGALALIDSGVSFLQAARDWWEARGTE
jgi:hypothetical protein